jgi:hypothetical protein
MTSLGRPTIFNDLRSGSIFTVLNAELRSRLDTNKSALDNIGTWALASWAF